ncbi:hypothetical protein V490_07401 [Pseudogymnoascus sp. VKM F-3557]|nr:hypothetical protein V490_07401 [Pseudogymnoascus sp. VKM F-3557]
MSDILQMPGGWISDREEFSATTHEGYRPPPPPPPPPRRRREPLLPFSQMRLPPENPPPLERRRASPLFHLQNNYVPLRTETEGHGVPLPTTRLPVSEYEYFADDTHHPSEGPPPSQSLPGSSPPHLHHRHIPTPTTTPGRHIPIPTTTQGRYVPLPTTRSPVSEYEFFADISNYGDGGTAEDKKKPIVIAVFGKTGTGKTSFIKAVTGKDLKVGHGLTSCTEKVLPVPCRIGSKNVILVDTPGFSDTNVSDTEILRRIAEWMKDSYDDGILLSGIIYLHNISDVRMDGPSVTNLRMMRKLCGTSSLKNVVLATTMWEDTNDILGSERELELQQTFWKDMISDGSTVARVLTKSSGDAREIVKSLLNNEPLSTRLQEELNSGKSLIQTEAGTEIGVELAKQEYKLRKEYEAERAEWELALQSRDKTLARQIRAEMEIREHRRLFSQDRPSYTNETAIGDDTGTISAPKFTRLRPLFLRKDKTDLNKTTTAFQLSKPQILKIIACLDATKKSSRSITMLLKSILTIAAMGYTAFTIAHPTTNQGATLENLASRDTCSGAKCGGFVGIQCESPCTTCITPKGCADCFGYCQ